MQKLRLIFGLCLSLSLSLAPVPASAQGREVPVLPADPTVCTGHLSNGIAYALATNNAVKGSAEVLLLQRVCQRVDRVEFPDVRVYKGAAEIDSLLSRIFRIIAASVEDDPDNYGTDNQYIVISGDIKAADIVARMEKYAAPIGASRSRCALPDYRWEGPYAPVIGQQSLPGDAVLLSMECRRRRTPDRLMPTAVPVVSMRMDGILEILLRKSISSSMERCGIPCADLSFQRHRAWNGYGDEIYRISFKTASEDASRARQVAGSVIAAMLEDGIPAPSYDSACSEVMSELHSAVNYPISNRSNALRLASHLLYGAPLASPEDVYGFFAGKELADSVQIRSFNRYVGELFRGYVPPDSLCAEARMVCTNKRDTLNFPQPSRKKARVERVSTDPVTGGTLWSFENGMRVIYRQMPTHGRLSYSMVFNCGASDIPGAGAGESAFYSELFHSASVGVHSGSDFRKLHESCGISMDCNVGLYDMALSGTASSGELSLLLKTLLQALNARRFSASAAAYTLDCSALSLNAEDECFGRLYTSLHPGYLYPDRRMRSGLGPGLALNAERLFEKAFSSCDDGVLVLVGDRPAEDVLKLLRRHILSFRTSGRLKKARSVPFTTISGSRSFSAEGERGIYMELSAAMDYTADNYFAARVLGEALRELLSGCAAKVEVSLNPRPSEHIDLRISARGDVREEELLSALRLLSEGDKESYKGLKDWRVVCANREAALRRYPEYWLRAARTRFTDSKDIATKSEAKISAVSAEKLMQLSKALLSGGRVSLETQPN